VVGRTVWQTTLRVTFVAIGRIACTPLSDAYKKSHRLTECTRCGRSLQMSHVAWSVRLCLLVTQTVVLCKNGWTDREPVSWVESSEFKEPPIRWVSQDRTNPLAAARGDKTAMRPFCQFTLDSFSFFKYKGKFVYGKYSKRKYECIWNMYLQYTFLKYSQGLGHVIPNAINKSRYWYRWMLGDQCRILFLWRSVDATHLGIVHHDCVDDSASVKIRQRFPEIG